MRTLSEIIEATRNGEQPDYEELRYAVCALEALSVFDDMALRKLVKAEQEGKKPVLVYSAKFQYEERFNRQKLALGKSPKEWVGWNNDPENPAVLERRRKAIRLVERILAKF